MLALDDPRWSELSHAYGAATDIPARLRDLAAAPEPIADWQDEPWYGLWSSLCHQGDVYTASYAAVPHITAIAMRTTGPVDHGFFGLPAAIELARTEGRGPEIPVDLEPAYREAIVGLAECVALHRRENWDLATLLSAITALAVAKGQIEAARALFLLDENTIAGINTPEFLERWG
jgi:ABC-type arginine transport system permease subunit